MLTTYKPSFFCEAGLPDEGDTFQPTPFACPWSPGSNTYKGLRCLSILLLAMCPDCAPQLCTSPIQLAKAAVSTTLAMWTAPRSFTCKWGCNKPVYFFFLYLILIWHPFHFVACLGGISRPFMRHWQWLCLSHPPFNSLFCHFMDVFMACVSEALIYLFFTSLCLDYPKRSHAFEPLVLIFPFHTSLNKA